MKKLIWVMVVLCLVAAVAFGAVSMRGTTLPSWQTAGTDAASEPGTDPTAGWVMDEIGPLSEEDAAAVAGTTNSATPAAPEAEAQSGIGRVDFEALYALHDPEEKVLSIGGTEESWGDYFYVLYTQGSQVENYFDSMDMYYGIRHAWEDPVEEGGESTYADAVVESAGNLLRQLAALERFAEENSVEISEEMLATIDSQKKEDIASVLGEEGTADEFFEYLAGQYLSPEMYNRVVTQNVLYQECFNQLYGKDAEKLPDETAMKYLAENNYRSAAHILFLFNDPDTGEVRDEDTLAGKKDELAALGKELRNISDPAARAKKFLEKTAELSEDSGKAYYPDGYTYTPGTMVTPFEEAVDALADYEISEVVETDYGYHLIIRLPLEADAVVEFSSGTGEARTGRMLAANQEYGDRLQALSDSLEVKWLDGAEAPVLTDFIR